VKKVKNCTHHITRTRPDKMGQWCELCGEKVIEQNNRMCQFCKFSGKMYNGWICKKKMITILPTMFASYKIKDGSCFENDDK